MKAIMDKRYHVVTVLSVLFVSCVCIGAEFSGVETNMTPEIPTPTGWEYGLSPGVFFWSGFATSLGFGLLASGATVIRRIIGGTREDS